MTDDPALRTDGAVRYWTFDPDHPHFADVPLVTRNATGDIVAVRGTLPHIPDELAERIATGDTYGYLTNYDLNVVQLVAVSDEFIDPREQFVFTFDEDLDDKSLLAFRDCLNHLTRVVNRALRHGWEIVESRDDLFVAAPPADAGTS